MARKITDADCDALCGLIYDGGERMLFHIGDPDDMAAMMRRLATPADAADIYAALVDADGLDEIDGVDRSKVLADISGEDFDYLRDALADARRTTSERYLTLDLRANDMRDSDAGRAAFQAKADAMRRRDAMFSMILGALWGARESGVALIRIGGEEPSPDAPAWGIGSLGRTHALADIPCPYHEGVSDERESGGMVAATRKALVAAYKAGFGESATRTERGYAYTLADGDLIDRLAHEYASGAVADDPGEGHYRCACGRAHPTDSGCWRELGNEKREREMDEATRRIDADLAAADDRRGGYSAEG